MKQFFITGGTGLIGTHLIREILKSGEAKITVASRSPENVRRLFGGSVRFAFWNPEKNHLWYKQLEGVDVVINLAGQSIAGGWWSRAYKEQILQSRLQAVQAFNEAFRAIRNFPALYIQASATGYYGHTGSTTVDETGTVGKGFLADIAYAWENFLDMEIQNKSRVVFLRTGLVLSRSGGILPKMLIPFRLGLGGALGDGRQGLPWISIEDEIGAILHIINNKRISGPVNLAGPEAVDMKAFAGILAKILHRPAFFHIPGALIRLLGREMGQELVLSGQNVRPVKLLGNGYRFIFTDIEQALRHELNRSADRG